MTTEGEPELEELVRTIDAHPDPLHADFTPSVYALINRGVPGAHAVVHLLDAPQRSTRVHAQRVLEAVVMRRHGWQAGRGYPDAQGEARTRAVLSDNGSYSADDPPERRQAAIGQWRRWLDTQTEERA